MAESIFSLQALEAKLVSYVNDVDAADEPFDTSSIPKISRVQAAKEAARMYHFTNHGDYRELNAVGFLLPGPSTLETIAAPAARSSAASPLPPTAAETQSSYVQQLAEVPEFADYGAPYNSTKLAQLTERETEYQVSCVKHIFKEHIVFQV
jgi:coatomer subunit gamma